MWNRLRSLYQKRPKLFIGACVVVCLIAVSAVVPLTVLFLEHPAVRPFWEHPAVQSCRRQAIDAFYKRDWAPGGWIFLTGQATITPRDQMTYQVESGGRIITGGYKNDKFDYYPEQRYSATYTCVATYRTSEHGESSWEVQLTYISPLKLISCSDCLADP
jgi:hypothetical protein